MDCEKTREVSEWSSGKPGDVSGDQSTRASNETAGLERFLRMPGWLWGLLIIGITIIAYWPLRQAGFIWDDDTFLLNNPLIRQGNGLYLFWFSTKAPDYFPMTSTTLWLEWRLWGTDPLGYHIVNVLLHAASAVLIWRVLACLKIPGAWLAAAIFAVHPVNAESVAWITERKNTLSMLFFASAILGYLRFEDTGQKRWYGISLCAFLLALLSKTAVAPLPLVLLGMAWWRRGTLDGRDIKRSLPFFCVALLLGLTTVWFQSHNAIGSDIVRADSFLSRLAAAGCALWFYLYKALWPVNLAFVYPKWQIDAVNPLSYVPGLLAAAVAVTLWLYRRSWGRAGLFGLGYFAVMLIPVLGFWNIYFMRYSLVADHWQYFAIIGPIGLVAAGASRAAGRLKTENIFGVAVFCSILLLTLCVLTWRQTLNYKNTETILEATIAKNPACLMCHNSLGHLFEEKNELLPAINHYGEVIRFDPNNVDAYNNRGSVYSRLGQYREAMDDFHKALSLNPDYPPIYNNLGVLYDQTGQYQRAIEIYRKALLLKPDSQIIYINIGNIYTRLGRYQKALDNYDKAILLDAGNAYAFKNRGTVYTVLRQYRKAVEDFNSALRLKPDDAELYTKRGIAYLNQGNTGMGCRDAQKACSLGSCRLLEAAQSKRDCVDFFTEPF